jgi:predicted heme/steroid binding protein
MRRLYKFLLVPSLLFLLAACNPNQNISDEELTQYTIEEIAAFDGQNGNDAYIVVEGYVYDVTNHPEWDNGSHNGIQAGQDVTEAILASSPHGTQVLSEVPKIGIIVESDVTEDPTNTEDPNTTEDPVDDTLYFTLLELAEYDGLDGQPAYIAVNGIVYDVTNSNMWNNGTHNGFTAGQDLTEEILTYSPHGLSVLAGIPIIGELLEE